MIGTLCLPESGHPCIEVFRAQTFDVKGGSTRIQMNILASHGGGERGMG